MALDLILVGSAPTALARLQTYDAAYDALVDGVNVFGGDTQSFAWFIAHPEERAADEVHMTTAGNAALAGFWSSAIIALIES